MPRPKKQHDGPNSVIASAARVQAGRKKNRPKSGANGEPWQTEAWLMLDTVGELEFYRQWVANACSRVTLSAVEVAQLRKLPDGEFGHCEECGRILVP